MQCRKLVIIAKVWTFWEEHKIWKNLPLKIWHYWVTSNFKWKIFSNFVSFSECPNFTLESERIIKIEFTQRYIRHNSHNPKFYHSYFHWYFHQNTYISLYALSRPRSNLSTFWPLNSLFVTFLKTENSVFLMQIARFDRSHDPGDLLLFLLTNDKFLDCDYCVFE